MSQTGGEYACRQCGFPLGSGERLMGLCPRCLMARIIDVRREVQAQMQRVTPWPQLPDPARLSEALPSLEIGELIGRGGMGLVYKARQKNLSREVALKILPAERELEPTVAARFVEEATILGQLNHANIVMALDAGQVGDWFYLVMELVNGPNLREVLKAQGRLQPPQALEVAKQLSAALAYAHSHGVVHRDIKPENLLLQPAGHPATGDLAEFFVAGGKVRVADFGIARLLQETDLTLTAPQQVVGTLDYLAPEYRHGTGDPGPAGDVYAVGVMLYEMLTGKTPVGHFPPPSKLTKVDARLDEIVMTALRSDPSERYADGETLHRAIVRAAGGRRLGRRLLASLGAFAVIAVSTTLLLLSNSGDEAATIQQGSPPVTAVPAEASRDVRVLMPGDSVKALWGDQWLDATVVEREGRRVKIHYEGWSETLDEWVGADRLRW